MAKFKKKKSKPTSDPDDSKIESIKNKSDNTPGTEKSNPEIPSKNSSFEDAEKSEKDKKLNKLFWMRAALAIIAGTAATFIFEDIEGEDKRWASIGFMIVIFLGTIIFAKSMKMQLPSSDRKKIFTQAIGSYVFLYLFTWIVTHTLVFGNPLSNGINI